MKVIEILRMDPLPGRTVHHKRPPAIACMRTLIKAGIRVPQNIAIVGFNNDFMSRMIDPDLTTIDNPAMEMGTVAAQHLLQQINKNIPLTISNTILVGSRLIVRSSSLRKQPVKP
ncbi:substrate-binding domain-containing protein [Parapedobacter deserti]|uniref:Substrate-binding domain-containing protein n=1 Tax=Parapedobacter deserti TaxID=1912957 RepID=A0ABV7JEE7_9SPHI